MLGLVFAAVLTIQAQDYHFQEGFVNNAPPAGWLATNVVYSNNVAHNHGLYPGDYSAKLKPNESFLMFKALNTADTLQFFIKVRDTITADTFHIRVEKSYDKNTWTLLAQDPCNMTWGSVYQKVTIGVKDPAPEIYLRLHAVSVNGTASLGLCYVDDISVTKLAVSPGDATLTELKYDTISIEGFTATNLIYQMELPYYYDHVTVSGTPNNPNATVTITNPTYLRGTEAERTGTVSVTSPDGTSTKAYKIIFTLSDYIYALGFNKTGDGVMPLKGWTGGYTYTSTTIPMGDHGTFPGPAALKFMRGQPDKIGFLITAKYVKSDTLNFWLAVDQGDGIEQLLIEKRVLGGVKVALANLLAADMSPNWQQFTYPIKENDSTEIIFTPTLTSEGLTRIWIDDLSMKGKKVPSAVPQLTSSQNITLFPNPVSTFLNVRLNASVFTSFDIYNVTGSSVYSSEVNQNLLTIDMRNWKAGVYFVTFSGAAAVSTMKIIKK